MPMMAFQVSSGSDVLTSGESRRAASPMISKRRTTASWQSVSSGTLLEPSLQDNARQVSQLQQYERY